MELSSAHVLPFGTSIFGLFRDTVPAVNQSGTFMRLRVFISFGVRMGLYDFLLGGFRLLGVTFWLTDA